ncbi:MAG: hypothetical protein NVV59_18555 [Chitinophagaceae bacterium]|nr:hypothetical protein [Chitinophagaceae bacterium]
MSPAKRDEFGHFSGTEFIFSEGIKALIFWFFCIKVKEHAATVEDCQQEESIELRFFCIKAKEHAGSKN